MALVGMAAFFGATVRAPVTGMVVVTEMTATTEVLVPMMAATVAAVLVAYLIGSPPIYDSLRERMPDEASIEGAVATSARADCYPGTIRQQHIRTADMRAILTA